MKIICDTANLQTAILFTGRVINKNTVIPVLEGYLIQAKGKAVTVTTTDLETTVTKAFPAEITAPKNFVLDYSAAAFIKAMAKDSVITLEVDENYALTITCSKKFGKFMCENAESYPVLPEVESEQAHVLTDDFQKAVERSLKYISTDELRPAMTGLYFCKNDLAATDAHRMYTYGHHLGLQTSFICPVKAATLMVKLKDCKMKFQTGNNSTYVSFYNKSTLIVTRGIDARFPDYKCVIPKDNSIKWKVNKAALKEALTTVIIAANQSTKLVRLEVGKSETVIRAMNCDLGMEATDTLASTCNQPEFKIAFNSAFLLNLVNDTTGEDVEMLFGSPSKAGIMKQDTELILLMPLMINDDDIKKPEPKVKQTKAEATKAAEEEADSDDLKDLEQELKEELKEEATTA